MRGKSTSWPIEGTVTVIILSQSISELCSAWLLTCLSIGLPLLDNQRRSSPVTLLFKTFTKILRKSWKPVEVWSDNFHVLDYASTGFRLKMEEAIHIQREQTILESTITPCKSKTILLILTFSCFTSFLVVTIYHN